MNSTANHYCGCKKLSFSWNDITRKCPHRHSDDGFVDLNIPQKRVVIQTLQSASDSHYASLRRCLWWIPVVFLLLLVAILAVVVILYIRLTPVIENSTLGQSKSELCLTPECLQLANHIVSRINKDVSPCEDFYEFACGKWIKTVDIPDGRLIWNEIFSVQSRNNRKLKSLIEDDNGQTKFVGAELKVKTFYDSCLDKGHNIEKLGVSPLRNLLDSLGGFSLLSTIDYTNWSLHDTLIKISKVGFLPLSWIGSTHDDRNTTRYIITIEKPLLTHHDQILYINRTTGKPYLPTDKVRQSVLNMMVEIGQLMGAEKNESRDLMEKILDFETEIAMIQPDESQKSLYIVTTPNELNEHADFLNWTQLLDDMYANSTTFAKGESPILLQDFLWITQLNELVRRYLSSPETTMILDSYLKWYVIANTIAYLPNRFQEPMKKLDKMITGHHKEYFRWQLCLARTQQTLALPLSSLFVRNHFSAEDKSKAQQIGKQIEKVFAEEVRIIPWMDSGTKKAALNKLDKIVNMVGYGEEIIQEEILSKTFENMFMQEDDFFDNMIRAYTFYRQRNLNLIDKRPNRYEWEYPVVPTSSNAYYDPKLNRIALPAGILSEPLFSKSQPMWMNFGGIGVIFGHELTHAFDNEGKDHDESGNLVPWWSEDSANMFEEKAQCFVEQYSNYSCTDIPLDGLKTLGENIADSTGVKLAFKAYSYYTRDFGRENLKLPGVSWSNEQLLFISFAQSWCAAVKPTFRSYQMAIDVHSPEKLRVTGALSNLPSFSSVFNCPVGSPLNPVKKCEIW